MKLLLSHGDMPLLIGAHLAEAAVHVSNLRHNYLEALVRKCSNGREEDEAKLELLLNEHEEALTHQFVQVIQSSRDPTK